MLIPIECDCGAVKGTVEAKNLKGYRAICLCDDCQAYAHYLKRSDILDENGGTDVLPTPPSAVKITDGFQNVKALRLSPNGMFRWYAGCCSTPIGNTMKSTTIPYVGMVHRIFEKKNSNETLENLFGPVKARLQGQFGKGQLPKGTLKTVSPGFLSRVLKFMALAMIRQQKWPSPFFNKDDSPKVKPYVLTKEERIALRPLCGQKRDDL